MPNQTMVWVVHPTGATYLVEESVDEVRKRWLSAGQDHYDDKASVVELTCVTGYFDPYRVVIAPQAISHVEEAQGLMAEYSAMKTRERWEKSRKEISGQTAGFDG